MAEHRIVVPGVVGSSPITHPRKKEKETFGSPFFFLWVFVKRTLLTRPHKTFPRGKGFVCSPVEIATSCFALLAMTYKTTRPAVTLRALLQEKEEMKNEKEIYLSLS